MVWRSHFDAMRTRREVKALENPVEVVDDADEVAVDEHLGIPRPDLQAQIAVSGIGVDAGISVAIGRISIGAVHSITSITSIPGRIRIVEDIGTVRASVVAAEARAAVTPWPVAAVVPRRGRHHIPARRRTHGSARDRGAFRVSPVARPRTLLLPGSRRRTRTCRLACPRGRSPRGLARFAGGRRSRRSGPGWRRRSVPRNSPRAVGIAAAAAVSTLRGSGIGKGKQQDDRGREPTRRHQEGIWHVMLRHVL